MTLYITGYSGLEFTSLRKEMMGKGWIHSWMGKGFLSPFWKPACVPGGHCVLGAVGVLALGGRVQERLGPEWIQKTLHLQYRVLGASLRVGVWPVLILRHFSFPFCHLSCPVSSTTFTLKGTTGNRYSLTISMMEILKPPWKREDKTP